MEQVYKGQHLTSIFFGEVRFRILPRISEITTKNDEHLISEHTGVRSEGKERKAMEVEIFGVEVEIKQGEILYKVDYWLSLLTKHHYSEGLQLGECIRKKKEKI